AARSVIGGVQDVTVGAHHPELRLFLGVYVRPQGLEVDLRIGGDLGDRAIRIDLFEQPGVADHKNRVREIRARRPGLDRRKKSGRAAVDGRIRTTAESVIELYYRAA